MSASNLTFEEVDKHIQNADLSSLQPGGQFHVSSSTAATPAAALPNVCAAYKVVKPILTLVAALPIIPQKWKDAIKAFMGILDALCP